MTRLRINLFSVLFMFLGFGSAVLVYFTAEPENDDSMVDDFRHGKKYQRELAVYGGKANVVAADFMDWFDGLWHGRKFARTLIVLTVGGVLIFRVVTLPPETPPEEKSEPPPAG